MLFRSYLLTLEGKKRKTHFWFILPSLKRGLPWWLSGKESAYQCRKWKFNPWVRKISWRKWQPTPVFLSGKSHGQSSLVGYSPWGHKKVGHNLGPSNNIQLLQHQLKRLFLPLASLWKSTDHKFIVYFWSLNSVPLIYRFIHMTVLHCFDWCRFVVSVEIGKCKSSFFFFEIFLVALLPYIFMHCINTGLGVKFFRKERKEDRYCWRTYEIHFVFSQWYYCSLPFLFTD